MKNEIKPLTGIRAFAAWWVVLYHLTPGVNILLPGVSPYLAVFSHGDKGVDLFFILSGFVLTYNYSAGFSRAFGGAAYRRFLWLRLARIYPVHLLGLAAWVVLAVANLILHRVQITPGFFGMPALAANLLLVQAWSVPMRMTWNYPAWSISLEWLAYLGFPFLVSFAGRLRSVRLMAALVAAVALTAPLLASTPYFHLIRIFTEFWMGSLLYYLYARGAGRSFPWEIIAAAALPAVIVLSDVVGEFVLPVLVLLVYALAADRGLAARALGSGLATYWGRVSYSLYIMHAAVITVLHGIIPPQRFADSHLLLRVAIVGAYVLCIGGAGALVYHYVEEPCRQKMRARLGTLRTEAPAAA
jgi:peptidoglycan/LPS O-acetylase OafA/YrhL